jgi:hypothetical protein
MGSFHTQVLACLPLAEAVFSMFSLIASTPLLERIFEDNRGRCYEKCLPFANLVRLVRDALLEHGGSGRASFDRAQEAHTLEVATSNAYGKLGRLPVPVALGLLRQTTQQLQSLWPACRRSLPACLQGLSVLVLDGKTIKSIPRRIKALRHLRGRMVGGKLLAALDLATGLVLAINAHVDGQANEVPLTADLARQVRTLGLGAMLWMGDRAFCNLKLLADWAAAQEHFLVRYKSSLKFCPDRQRPGNRPAPDIIQQWGWLGAPSNKRRRYVRRVTLKRPGQQKISLVTDLLEEAAYPAEQLLEGYLQRGSIEQVFQQVTEVFHLRGLISTTPQGTIFQAAFCMLIYNMVQVLKGHAAEAGRVELEQVSGEKLFEDVRRQCVAWAELTESPQAMAAPFLLLPPAEKLKERISQLVAAAWSRRWLKGPPKKNWKRTRRTHYPASGHTSVHKALERYRQRKRRQPATAQHQHA